MSARFASLLPAITHDWLRPVDIELGDWLATRSGSPALGLAACAAAAAEGLGHSCARLDRNGRPLDLPGFPALDLDAMRDAEWVGDGSRPTPLVLTGSGLYLWRMHALERRVAEQLLARCSHRDAIEYEPLPPPDDAPGQLGLWDRPPDPLAADIDALFAGTDPVTTWRQRIAVAAAPGNRLFVLTGGPGTGKTSTVVRMLALLLRRHAELGHVRMPRTVLAAPTGKAGQRLAEAVRSGRRALAASLDAAWQAALAAIPDDDAPTLHRLLGWSPRRERASHDRDNPLPADIVVVDEASMIDLGLMAALLDALPPQAMLILLGDPDQLSAVGAGSVLADLVAAGPTGDALDADAAERTRRLAGIDPASRAQVRGDGRGPLAGRMIALRHVWRAAGALVRLPQRLRDEPGRFIEHWQHAVAIERDPGLQWQRPATAAALGVCIDQWLQHRRDDLLGIGDGGLAPLEALARLRHSVLLTALRDGPFGAAGVNHAIEHRLRQWLGLPEQTVWYPGRPVIVTRNTPALGLYNGDVGIALAGPEGLRVWFERRDREGRPAAHAVAPRLLGEHASAFALTVHKSQGSEYDEVILLLPPDPQHPLLSRQLLYTGMTRARQRLQLWATDAVLHAAANRVAARGSGLSTRLLPALPTAGEVLESS